MRDRAQRGAVMMNYRAVLLALAVCLMASGGSIAATPEDNCIAAGKLAFSIARARDACVSEDLALQTAQPGPLHKAVVDTVAIAYRFPSITAEKLQADVTFSCLQSLNKN